MGKLFSALVVAQIVIWILQAVHVFHLGIFMLLLPIWAMIVLAIGALFLFVFIVGLAVWFENHKDE